MLSGWAWFLALITNTPMAVAFQINVLKFIPGEHHQKFSWRPRHFPPAGRFCSAKLPKNQSKTGFLPAEIEAVGRRTSGFFIYQNFGLDGSTTIVVASTSVVVTSEREKR